MHTTDRTALPLQGRSERTAREARDASDRRVDAHSGRRADPLADPRSQRRADKPNRRPLRNTPPVARENIRLFAELFGDPQANAARWFVAAITLMLVVAGQAFAIVRMLPLKQVVPYAVEHSADGAVVRVVEAGAYKPMAAVVKSELARWVERLLVIDPYLTRENLRLSIRPLRGKAVSQHKEYVDLEAPFKRLIATPGLVRTARPSGVDVSQDGIAFVFVTTTERAGTADALTRKWRFTVHYVLAVPQTEDDVLANPAGLVITHFERAQDLS